MKRPRWTIIILLVILALLLSGCINIKQEYWLNGDGSARVGMDIGMSQALLAMGNDSQTQANPFDNLKKEYNTTNPKLKNVQVKEYKENDLQHFSVTFDVADFQDFLKSQTSSQDQLNITLTQKPGGSIQFRQVTRLDSGMSGVDNSFDSKTMEPMFKDMYWMVTVHVPELVTTNGTKIDGSTAQWKIPMLDVFTGKAPSELTLEYNPRGNGGIAGGGVSGGAGGSSLLVLLLVVLFLLLVGGAAAYYFLVLHKRPAGATIGAPETPGQPAQPGPYAGYVPPQFSQGGSFPPQSQQAPFPAQPQAGYPPQEGQGLPQEPDGGPQIPARTDQAPIPPPQYPQVPQYPQYPPVDPQTSYYTPPSQTPSKDPERPA